jgi:hydrolase
LDLSHVLLTHWHGDHTGGVPDLIAYDSALASRIYKNQPDPGQKPIEDGQVFRTEGATLRAVFTPGHAVDHMCFAFEEEDALFTGDNVLGHGYSVAEDLGVYMKSLEDMENQRCAIGYPAHGAKILDLPLKLKQYIRHKKTRERQVFSALVSNKSKVVNAGQRSKASLTTRELVTSLHGEVPEDMFEMALEPFMTEVLWKLAEDRKVGFELSAGTRKWFVNERTWAAQATVH